MQDTLKDIPLLVFANKQDDPKAMDALEISKQLGLDFHEGTWSIKKSTGVSGMGLDEGLTWLLKILMKVDEHISLFSSTLARTIMSYKNDESFTHECASYLGLPQPIGKEKVKKSVEKMTMLIRRKPKMGKEDAGSSQQVAGPPCSRRKLED
ncbi:hypothetical protein PTKIN_Ptkin11bG0145000 [Pterospermum kingtungense]